MKKTNIVLLSVVILLGIASVYISPYFLIISILPATIIIINMILEYKKMHELEDKIKEQEEALSILNTNLKTLQSDITMVKTKLNFVKRTE